MKLAPVVASLKNTQRSDLVIFQNWFQFLTSTNGSFHTSLKTLFCSSQYLSCCYNSPFRQNQHFLPNWFLHMVNPGILCSWTTESRNWHTGLLGQCAFASQSTCPAAQLCRFNTAVRLLLLLELTRPTAVQCSPYHALSVSADEPCDMERTIYWTGVC